MSKTLRRFLWAVFFSAIPLVATLTWYALSERSRFSEAKSKPIARLVHPTNEVQRKSAQRLIWQPVYDNELLEAGESIRTAPDAEARIEFLNITTAIDLEPDSAIVLEESDGKPTLDLVKGNIFVKSEADEGLTFKSDGKKIEIGSSEVTLEKGKNGTLTVEVLKGHVGGLEKESQKIKILRPAHGEAIYLNPKNNEQVLFEWQPLAKGYVVFLETGDSRGKLKLAPGISANGEIGRLTAPIKVGKRFFRFVARSQGPNQPELSSTVLRTQIIAKIPPILLSPERDMSVTKNPESPVLKFSWANPAGYLKIIVEIASTADLKQKIKTEYLENVTEYNFEFQNPGTYFWRVSGIIDGKKEVVSSSVQNFKLKFEAPQKTPTLSWTDGKLRDEFYYATTTPTLPLKWEKGDPRATSWGLRILASVGEPISQTISVPEADVSIAGEGVYTAEVEAYDATGAVLARSQKRIIKVASAPLLPAPIFFTADEIEANRSGTANLKWQSVAGASQYVVVLKSKDSAQELSFQTAQAELKGLLPGEYTVSLRSVDENGRPGPEGETRVLKVPNISNVQAPKLKGMKVK